MKKKIIVKAPLLSQSGYGEQARFAMRALKSSEELFDIYAVNLSWGHTSWLWEETKEREWLDDILVKTALLLKQNPNFQFDISLQVTIPNEWEKMAPVNIGYTAGIETTRVAPGWIEKAYLMNRIIVPSQHSKDVYEQTFVKTKHPQTGEDVHVKVACPIEAVNFPFKNVEPCGDLGLDLAHDFNFLTVAQWSPRKNLENTILWFLEEFSGDEVGLVVKASLANNSYVDNHHSLEKLRAFIKVAKPEGAKCKVYLLHGYLKEEEMAALYTHPKIKAFVSFSHGEGFGLPLHESAGYGLPIITTRWSGPVDFLRARVKKKSGKEKTRSLFTEVDYGLEKIQPQAVWPGVLEAESMWAYPTKESAKSSMRKVYSDYKPAMAQADKLQKWILENWSPESQYEEFISAMGFDDEEIKWLQELSNIEIL